MGLALYPIGINQSYGQTNTVPDTVPDTVSNTVSITGPDISVPPIAPDFTVEVLRGQRTADLILFRFSEHVTDAADAYSDLIIKFIPQDEGIYRAFNSITGIEETKPFSGEVTVNAETVRIFTRLSGTYSNTLLFDYTVTNTAGLSATGLITVDYVDILGDVMANPHTVTLLNLFGLPTLELEITNNEVQTILLEGTRTGQFFGGNYMLTTASTSNGTGTLSITRDADSFFTPILAYTPSEGFVGTETFDYTIEVEGKSASSKISIVVPELVCNREMDTGIDFGTVYIGVESDTQNIDISNTGNADIQFMMKGDNWTSDADNSLDTILAGQTKYSLTEADTYAQKTPFTTTVTDVGERVGDGSLNVYVQLVIDLIESSFRGATTQELTVTSECPTS